MSGLLTARASRSGIYLHLRLEGQGEVLLHRCEDLVNRLFRDAVVLHLAGRCQQRPHVDSRADVRTVEEADVHARVAHLLSESAPRSSVRTVDILQITGTPHRRE